MNENVLKKLEKTINLFLDFLYTHISSNLNIPDELLNPENDSTKEIKKRFKDFIQKMEKLFINLNFPRLQNVKISEDMIETFKKMVGKLFPIFIFPKLKKYTLERKRIKLLQEKQNFLKIGRINISNTKQRELEALNSQPQKIEFYLPSGDGKYNSFLRYYLSNYYE